MPITKGALRKQRADTRKTRVNRRIKDKYKTEVTKARKKPTLKGLSELFSNIDKATKKGVMHKNKASRLKSRLAKLVK